MHYDVKNAKVLMNEEGKSKGSGFVYFNSMDEAMKLVGECQKTAMNLDGNRLFVQMSRQ